jgi:hypothetical protein
MSNEHLTPEEIKAISLFGIINGAILHPSTPKEIKSALSGSLANVLMDEGDQFGFKGTDIQNDLLGALQHTLKRLMREEEGDSILSNINLN